MRLIARVETSGRVIDAFSAAGLSNLAASSFVPAVTNPIKFPAGGCGSRWRRRPAPYGCPSSVRWPQSPAQHRVPTDVTRPADSSNQKCAYWVLAAVRMVLLSRRTPRTWGVPPRTPHYPAGTADRYGTGSPMGGGINIDETAGAGLQDPKSAVVPARRVRHRQAAGDDLAAAARPSRTPPRGLVRPPAVGGVGLAQGGDVLRAGRRPRPGRSGGSGPRPPGR